MTIPTVNQSGHKKIKNILVSQPEPEAGVKTPYHALIDKYDVSITYRPFIKVQGLLAKDFRKSRIVPNEFTSVIFTSRNAVNHFFRLCDEMKIKMSQNTKYFCVSESIALYLQKFILYRKRKVFFDKTSSIDGLKELLKKHRKTEKFLFPCAADRKDNIEIYLKDENYNFAPAIMFETVAEDLSGLDIHSFDMVIFFSPIGIKSLIENFPGLKQGDLVIGAFGPLTAQTVTDSGFRLDFQAPAPGITSITQAIDNYLANNA
ncbi:MAG: uroporphyrinogen-III synthase [Sphingobacteriales bacterium]|nr:MAG: uroporphyrinogen-III synthase [Sphingobacteriales bacterium]